MTDVIRQEWFENWRMAWPTAKHFMRLKRARQYLLPHCHESSNLSQCNAQALNCPHSATRITLVVFEFVSEQQECLDVQC